MNKVVNFLNENPVQYLGTTKRPESQKYALSSLCSKRMENYTSVPQTKKRSIPKLKIILTLRCALLPHRSHGSGYLEEWFFQTI